MKFTVIVAKKHYWELRLHSSLMGFLLCDCRSFLFFITRQQYRLQSTFVNFCEIHQQKARIPENTTID